jgi:cold shock protein
VVHARKGLPHLFAGGGAMVTGKVKWFDRKKGFGFIVGPEEDKDIFVHYTSIEGDGFRSLKEGESVEFDLVESEKGLQAFNVKHLDKP